MNKTNITKFLTQKTAVAHFLALTAFFLILLVVFAQPTNVLRYTSQTSNLNPLIQISITVLTGLVVVAVSRVLLALRGDKKVTAPGCFIWLFTELIVCVATMSLTVWLLSGGGRLMLAQLAGDFTLGAISVELLPYTIAFLLFLLRESQAEVERLRGMLPQETGDEHIVQDIQLNFYEKGGRLAFATMRSNILYIEAANNYTNIHYLNDGKEDTFILHNTLKELETAYDGNGLVRCHRGYMVNLGNVKLMRKDGTGIIIEIAGSQKVIPVTKTYAKSFTHRLQETEK